MEYFRENIARMEGYTPGFQPGEGDYVKLNTNENPYPPSSRVLEALQAECNSDLRLYPDPMAERFRETAAGILNVASGQILCGNGADDILNIVMRSFCDQGDMVAYPHPTYSLIRTLAQIQGTGLKTVDFPEDYSLPEGLSTAGAELTFVCNPNAPSGTFIDGSQLGRLADSLDGILLVDETYVQFCGDNCLELVSRFDNVVISRSLSKSHSLAGLRFGFCVANEQLVEGMTKVKDSYNVDRISIAGATAAIRDTEWVGGNARKIRKTRDRLVAELEQMGFYCWPSCTNFVLARVPPGEDGKNLHRRLFEKKILVRYFDTPRLKDCLRITVGTDRQIDALLGALDEILSAAKSGSPPSKRGDTR